MGTKQIAPWRKRPNERASKRDLRHWRRMARDRARARGAKTACICKRGVMEAGMVVVRMPGSWGSSAYTRRTVCYACAKEIIAAMENIERYTHREELPVEDLR